jgi:hemerythrin-like domain-containing protein
LLTQLDKEVTTMNIGILLDVNSVGLHVAIVRSIMLKYANGQRLEDHQIIALASFLKQNTEYLTNLCNAWPEARNGTPEDDRFFEHNTSDELWQQIARVCEEIENHQNPSPEDLTQAARNLERIMEVCSMIHARSGFEHPRF